MKRLCLEIHKKISWMIYLTLMILSFSLKPCFADDSTVIASKIFTESYILAEVAAQTVESNSTSIVTRKLGMGGTGLLFESLKSGAIDVYPDYTGTLAETILKKPQLRSLKDIRKSLEPLGLTISDSLGFNNTYALAVKDSFAKKYNLHSISDLQRVDKNIQAAFSYEFMDRQDGYHGLVKHYQLMFPPQNVRRMEHSLVYSAIEKNAVDLIEVYSTDANIKKFNLYVLTDDQKYFPEYQAVWVARKSYVEKHPQEWKTLQGVEGKISEHQMISMNAQADLEKQSYSKVAAQFLGLDPSKWSVSLTDEITLRTQQHLKLVVISLIFSVLVGIPLGVFAVRLPFVGQMILLVSALIQTIPALALLSFLIPIFGVGLKPSLVALCLYSLLPVVLNTFTALKNIDAKHIENSKAFGLTPIQILTYIELPLGSPIILAGVKTATIVSVGTATLAALVGAGGYGALIISGLSLNNTSTVLAGAIPAAVMALLAHIIFAIIAKLLIPRGLQRTRN